MTSREPQTSIRRLWATSGSVAGALLAVLVVAAGSWLWFDREEALEAGARSAEALARVLEEQTARSFEAVDLTLLGIVNTLKLNPSLDRNNLVFRDIMRRRLDSLPHVRALFVVGPDGFITQDTDYPTTPIVSLADREYFMAHARNQNPSMRIGRPLISRTPGLGHFVSVTRRIDGPEGEFGGVAVAALVPSHIEQFYAELASGGERISLYRRDGVLIARFPGDDAVIGEDLSDLDLFRIHLARAADGVFRTAGAGEEARRIVSYRSVDGFPLIVSVSVAESDLLAGWRRSVAAIAAAVAIMAILIVLLTVLWVQRRTDQERVLQQRMQLQQLEALGRMTGGVAHDFNNLMTIVANALTLIHKKVEDDDVRRIADTATAAVDRGTKLTRQMLAFARRQELKITKADVNELIRHMEALLRNAAGPGVELRLDLGSDVPPCLTDQTQFDTALLNLVVNARDAMPAGGTVHISTSRCRDEDVRRTATLKPGPYACVTVTDTGEGMPPDVLRQALDPFFTTKADKGTGLGLSQVYGFARQIGGDVAIESGVGRGTSVLLFLPGHAGA